MFFHSVLIIISSDHIWQTGKRSYSELCLAGQNVSCFHSGNELCEVCHMDLFHLEDFFFMLLSCATEIPVLGLSC